MQSLLEDPFGNSLKNCMFQWKSVVFVGKSISLCRRQATGPLDRSSCSASPLEALPVPIRHLSGQEVPISDSKPLGGSTADEILLYGGKTGETGSCLSYPVGKPRDFGQFRVVGFSGTARNGCRERPFEPENAS